jgi:hypothetical protein
MVKNVADKNFTTFSPLYPTAVFFFDCSVPERKPNPRLTNGFPKKWDNLNYALALYFPYYNFFRIHKTLRVTPAIAAGISKRVWELKDLIQFCN